MQTMYQQMDAAELDAAIDLLQEQVDEVKARGLKLDMARGKPSPAQVALSRPMLDVINAESDLTDGGIDCSNYGGFEGIPSARALAGQFLGVPAEQTLVLGSSSLLIMHDVAGQFWRCGTRGGEPWGAYAASHGGAAPKFLCPSLVLGSSSLLIMHDVAGQFWRCGTRGGEPWGAYAASHGGAAPKFLCPSPGYDRHFGITRDLGFENVPVPMTETGPDMDAVEALVKSDAGIKGIWCVPKYSNPTGVTYSDETVRRLVSMEAAAPDFRIFWDNAYCVHDIYDEGDELLNVFDAAREAGNEDRVIGFASTSKITFPGSGIAFVAASPAVIKEVADSLKMGLISADKMNQLRHVRFLPDIDAVRAHMRRHAEFMRPRFEAVERKLSEGLGGTGCAEWTHPRGGYFVSFDGPEGSAKHAEFMRPRFEAVERKLSEGLGGTGCAEWTHPRGGYFVSFDGPEGSAKRVGALCAEMGVKLTPAGATWPGEDPRDTNIRIAPSYPSVEELERALDVLVLAVKLVSAQLARESRD